MLRRRVLPEGRPGGSRGSKRARRGADLRGESIFANDVGGSVLQRWRVEVAASLAGELRGATSPLHKKMKGEALRVRHDIGKLGEEAKEAGDVEVHRRT